MLVDVDVFNLFRLIEYMPVYITLWGFYPQVDRHSISTLEAQVYDSSAFVIFHLICFNFNEHYITKSRYLSSILEYMSFTWVWLKKLSEITFIFTS